MLVGDDRNLSLGLEPAAAGYAWWRGALAGILAGASFALTLAAVLPRSSRTPQTSPAPVKSATNETPSSGPPWEDIAKKEVLVLPSVFTPADPPASEPIAPSFVEHSSVDDSSGDLQNCVGCSNPISPGFYRPTDAGAQQDASLSSDAQAPDAAQPAEVVQSPVVLMQPPPMGYFAVGAFSFRPALPPNAPLPGSLGMINPGFLGTIHAPAFGGMPVHR